MPTEDRALANACQQLRTGCCGLPVPVARAPSADVPFFSTYLPQIAKGELMSATQAASDVVREMAAAMEENRRYLTKLDSEIGDGDHGNNMHRGFQAAVERLGGAEPSTPADVLKAVSMALIGKVGGAAGPLYGTAFLRASTTLSDKEEVSAGDAAEALEAALGGIKQRGKAEVGDKTIVDALTPAVEAAKEAASSGDATVVSVFQAA